MPPGLKPLLSLAPEGEVIDDCGLEDVDKFDDGDDKLENDMFDDGGDGDNKLLFVGFFLVRYFSSKL